MPEIRAISVSGSIPLVNQLALGDLALNTFDGKLYLKKFANNTQTIIEVGGGVIQTYLLIMPPFSNPNITFTRGNGTTFSLNLSTLVPTSASYALTASYAENSIPPFPYTGSAEITGSLTVRGTSLVQDGSLGVVTTGTTNATDAFKVQNATPDDLLVVRDDGEIVVNTTKYSLNGVLTNNGGIITEVNGYNGTVVIDQSPNPPITLDIQNGLIINVL
jgi:hypothetical protein